MLTVCSPLQAPAAAIGHIHFDAGVGARDGGPCRAAGGHGAGVPGPPLLPVPRPHPARRPQPPGPLPSHQYREPPMLASVIKA